MTTWSRASYFVYDALGRDGANKNRHSQNDVILRMPIYLFKIASNLYYVDFFVIAFRISIIAVPAAAQHAAIIKAGDIRLIS